MGIPWDLGSPVEGGGFGGHVPGATEHPPWSWEGAGTRASHHPMPAGAVGATGTLSHAPGCVLSPERGKTPGLRPLHLQPGPRWEAARTH